MYFNFKIGFVLHQRSSVTPLVRIRRPGLTYKQTNLFFVYPTKNILQTNIKQLSDICPTVFCNILRISLLWLLAQSSPSLVDLSDLSLFCKGKKPWKCYHSPMVTYLNVQRWGGGGIYFMTCLILQWPQIPNLCPYTQLSWALILRLWQRSFFQMAQNNALIPKDLHFSVRKLHANCENTSFT